MVTNKTTPMSAQKTIGTEHTDPDEQCTAPKGRIVDRTEQANKMVSGRSERKQCEEPEEHPHGE